MATDTETNSMGLTPHRSMFVLVIIVGCFAVLWPRILSPMFVGPPKDMMDPNHYDKSNGCCDVLYDTDINAIKIMTELCGNILRSKEGGMDPKTEQAFNQGKLSKNIIDTCRMEVNQTCGVDIALFLNHNIALGKSFKQILDDIRSYNSSTCLKMNYGVSLGVPHVMGKWVQELDTHKIRQERPSHLKHPPIHPALRERGRAIPTPPRSVPHPTVPLVPHTGRPIPMRPPMGAPGRVAPPQKTSMGFLMPLYTLCIIIFFFYTMFKLMFRKNNPEQAAHPYKYVPDKQGVHFKKAVFNKAADRVTPEKSKIVVSAISGLVAEVRQQMEEGDKTDVTHSSQEPTPSQPYTNGSVPHEQREPSPILYKAKDLSTPPSWEDSTPVHREETILLEEFTPREPAKEATPEPVKEVTPEPVKQPSPEPVKKEPTPPRAEEDEEEEEEEEEEEVEVEEEEEKPREVEKIGTKHEEDIVLKLRSSVEKENATVKVVGMEMRMHCEGGKKWTSARPPTPPVASTPPAIAHPGRTTPDVEVSSIYLEGALPHQSKLLVSESETHTEKLTNGDDKDTPIVLSGKMTLSLINDTSSKSTPDREYIVKDDSTVDDDEEFVTASAATAPKQEEEDVEEGSEEEEEELEEDQEVVYNTDTFRRPMEDRGDAVLADTKTSVMGEEEEEEESEEEEEEEEHVVHLVEEPKVEAKRAQIIERDVDDEEEEELEEEEEEVEEEEIEVVADRTESVSVDARRDINTTMSTCSEGNTTKKVDDVEDEEYEEDEDIEDEILVEESKNATAAVVVEDRNSRAGAASSDNSLSRDSEHGGGGEEELEEEEEEEEYEEEEVEEEEEHVVGKDS